jgi:hypothetical protein
LKFQLPLELFQECAKFSFAQKLIFGQIWTCRFAAATSALPGLLYGRQRASVCWMTGMHLAAVVKISVIRSSRNDKGKPLDHPQLPLGLQ